MFIETTVQFKTVHQEILNRCTQKSMQNVYEFKQLLMNLGTNERILIGWLFRKVPWNIGSLRVLKVLQDSMILTATQYIMSMEDHDEIQLILNDFLEDEYELLMNLFSSAHYNRTCTGEKLNLLLNECLRGLFNDLLKNPKLNDLNYLHHVENDDLMIMIMKKHVNSVLTLQLDSMKECLRNFTYWLSYDDILPFGEHLYSKLLYRMQINTLTFIFKVSSVENFAGWKYYLILLQIMARKCSPETTTFIKKYLKTRLNEIASKPSERDMMHLLMTARASMAISTTDLQRNLNAYAEWYKQNICEMKFTMGASEFRHVLDMLHACVDFEMQTEYLEIHAAYNIAPPVYFGKQVSTYKGKCKSRLEQLKKN